MSRLFTVRRTIDEIADAFGVAAPPCLPVPTETVEGAPGLVVLERDGVRRLRSMIWGFPRPVALGGGPDRIGLVADLTNPLWDRIVVDPRYRCLIPLTHFANPAGEPGAKTRTWFSVTAEPLVAWAGFCRSTPEHGPVFASMTRSANTAVMRLNDRMPVLLGRDEQERWLHGGIEDVIEFQFRAAMAADALTVLPTADRWRSGNVPERPAARQMALL